MRAMRFLQQLDSAVIAWAVYAFTRLIDTMTTAILLELGGKNLALEAHFIPRLFMTYYGVHKGNLLHELAVLCAAILAYILLSVARRNISVMRLANPRLVPYTIGAASGLVALNNLMLSF
jgi:hypothetical protein